MQVITFNCSSGVFQSIQAVTNDSCTTVGSTTPFYEQTELIVAVHVVQQAGCGQMATVPLPLILEIVLPLVGVIIITGVVLMVVPATRRRLFPFADRQRHVFRTR